MRVSWEDIAHICLLAPDCEPMTNQSNDYTGVQISEAMSLLGLLMGPRMTQRQPHP